MSGDSGRKVVRSYRLVFRRRWRIFRIQNWRIPLPGGLELRMIGYWLACWPNRSGPDCLGHFGIDVLTDASSG